MDFVESAIMSTLILALCFALTTFTAFFLAAFFPSVECAEKNLRAIIILDSTS